jgi:hypothetical protein
MAMFRIEIPPLNLSPDAMLADGQDGGKWWSKRQAVLPTNCTRPIRSKPLNAVCGEVALHTVPPSACEPGLKRDAAAD